MADSRLFGTDTGKPNGPLNEIKLRDYLPRIIYVASRATISWAYVDPFLTHNMSAVLMQERIWLPYHVPYPNQSAIRQMDHAFRTVPNPGGWGRRVLDIELAGDGRGAPPAPRGKWADLAWKCSEICLERDGKRPIIYSRKNLIDAWLAPYWTADQLNEHYYWLAAYLSNAAVVWRLARGLSVEHPGPILLPKKVWPDRLLIHQTGDKTPAFCLERRPTGSGRQDTDRWVHPVYTPITLVGAP